MSIYAIAHKNLNAYIESLNGKRSTLESAMNWVHVNLYDSNEAAMLVGGMAIHALALDRAVNHD